MELKQQAVRIDRSGNYYFSQTFKQMLQQAQQEDPVLYRQFVEMFFFYMDQIKDLLKQHDDLSVYHNLIEHIEEQNKFSNEGTSCGKGCNFCCHLNVDSMSSEIHYIAERIKESGITVNKERLEKQAKAVQWNDLSYPDRRCVFLKDSGECGIYSFRPLSCRKYYVITPKEMCNSEIDPDGEVGIITYNHAEIVTSAMLNCWPSGRFHGMLYKKLYHHE